MRALLATAAMVGLMTGGNALAQQAQSADQEIVAEQGVAAAEPADDSFLCAFAGECAADKQTGETPLKAAPQTKGFRLAQTPTIPAPGTRGFRVASGPTVPAPNTRAFRVARSTAGAPASSVAMRRSERSMSRSRRYAAANRAPIVAGAPRTDLLLTFDYNSASMTRSAEGRARGFAQALMMPELRDKRFVIQGHTDARGSRDVNIDLSRRRAQAVADFLVLQGVDRSRVEVKGIGPDQPLPGRAANAETNRRVEAVLLS